MALSATLIEGLNRFGVGARLRELRRRERISLSELGRRTGLSSSLLSKLERGKMYPTLPTLQRIAVEFRVDLGHFFPSGRSDVAVVRRGERLRFPELPDARNVSYRFESLDYPASGRRLSAYLAEFAPMPLDHVRRHRHGGDELVFVVSGTLSLCFEDEEIVLEAEDAVYFGGRRPHGYRRVGCERCRAVVVITT